VFKDNINLRKEENFVFIAEDVVKIAWKKTIGTENLKYMEKEIYDDMGIQMRQLYWDPYYIMASQVSIIYFRRF
jgi:hypothetical protein